MLSRFRQGERAYLLMPAVHDASLGGPAWSEHHRKSSARHAGQYLYGHAAGATHLHIMRDMVIGDGLTSDPTLSPGRGPYVAFQDAAGRVLWTGPHHVM